MPAEDPVAIATENTPLLRAENVADGHESDNIPRPQDNAAQKESRASLKYIVPAISVGVSSTTLFHLAAVL
jgi:hypothetical protein